MARKPSLETECRRLRRIVKDQMKRISDLERSIISLLNERRLLSENNEALRATVLFRRKRHGK